ncbi:MAG TPA: hypothetical protein VIN93_15800 [Bryobacteraceae bacterium]
MLPIKVTLHQVLGEAYVGLVVGFDGIGATGDTVEEGGAQMLFERRQNWRLASVRYSKQAMGLEFRVHDVGEPAFQAADERGQGERTRIDGHAVIVTSSSDPAIG